MRWDGSDVCERAWLEIVARRLVRRWYLLCSDRELGDVLRSHVCKVSGQHRRLRVELTRLCRCVQTLHAQIVGHSHAHALPNDVLPE